ncbi:galactoside alpha-(1,2)-fucosyltransferase 2-like [Ornithodoros turicata]|uniref:galactoside alpha-(1,2)-fucosyltransferase 2-like n=1 Tax=Ornithodoros turicata TaxID=34597 RepID=UPI003138CC4B
MGPSSNVLAIGGRTGWFKFPVLLACLALAYVVIKEYKAGWLRSPGDGTAQDLHSTRRRSSIRGMMTAVNAGRLGNQMGSYAVMYSLAKLNRYAAYIHPRMHARLAPLFKLSLPVLGNEMQNISWVNFSGADIMSESYSHMTEAHIKLRGYYNSWTFFHHIKNEILEQFTFHEKLKFRAWSTLAKMRKGRRNPTFIAVHVRRGDYINLMPRKYQGVLADKEYFEKAMGYFRGRYQEPVFVVSSDGLQWCRENIDASRGDVYFANDWHVSSPIKDLTLLAHCNHTIMTIGTFGFWAAYLAGGEVVYLTNYTPPDSTWLGFFKPFANYLPEWIGMESGTLPLQSEHNLVVKPVKMTATPRSKHKSAAMKKE